jgi:hypothetical protein
MLDLSLAKAIPLAWPTENGRVEFRAAFFNGSTIRGSTIRGLPTPTTTWPHPHSAS